MEGAGETDSEESAHESASHFAAWAIVSAPLVLGFDLTNATRLDLAWPTISNALAINVSQSWEAGARRFLCDSLLFVGVVKTGSELIISDACCGLVFCLKGVPTPVVLYLEAGKV